MPKNHKKTVGSNKGNHYNFKIRSEIAFLFQTHIYYYYISQTCISKINSVSFLQPTPSVFYVTQLPKSEASDLVTPLSYCNPCPMDSIIKQMTITSRIKFKFIIRPLFTFRFYLSSYKHPNLIPKLSSIAPNSFGPQVTYLQAFEPLHMLPLIKLL